MNSSLEVKVMAASNTKKERRIYSIFSLDQFDKILDEMEREPLPDNWYLVAIQGKWKEYASVSTYLQFREEISHEEIEKLLGPSMNGNGDNQFKIEEWEFDEFSDDEYIYRFCVNISFLNNVATSGIIFWRKIKRE